MIADLQQVEWDVGTIHDAFQVRFSDRSHIDPTRLHWDCSTLVTHLLQLHSMPNVIHSTVECNTDECV